MNWTLPARWIYRESSSVSRISVLLAAGSQRSFQGCPSHSSVSRFFGTSTPKNDGNKEGSSRGRIESDFVKHETSAEQVGADMGRNSPTEALSDPDSPKGGDVTQPDWPSEGSEIDLKHQEESGRMLRVVRMFAGTTSGYPFSLWRYLGRWWWSAMFSKLCNAYNSKPLHKEVEDGAKAVVRMLFEKISARDWNALTKCVDAKLLEELRSATEALNGTDGKSNITMTIDIGGVKASRIVGFRLILGGERQSPTDGKSLMPALTPFGIAHFLLDEETIELFARRKQEGTSVKSAFRGGSDILREAMRRSGMVRVDVLCKTQQILTLKTDRLMMSSSEPETIHHLRFEAPLEPCEELEAEQGGPYFNWGDGWKLVDLNFVLKGI